MESKNKKINLKRNPPEVIFCCKPKPGSPAQFTYRAKASADPKPTKSHRRPASEHNFIISAETLKRKVSNILVACSSSNKMPIIDCATTNNVDNKNDSLVNQVHKKVIERRLQDKS